MSDLPRRVEALEVRSGRIEDKLDRVLEMLASKASRGDVWTALGTGAAIAFAVIAIFVGVLAYLQDQRIASRPPDPVPVAAPAPPQIIVIPIPQPPAPAPPVP